MVEGKPNADRFFIIRQGKVRISKDVEVVEEEGGSVLGPGDFFGVVSTMSSHSQIETAQAITDVTLISVMKEQYGQLIQNNTPVAMKIILQFSKRMRYLDEALTRLTLKNTAEEDVSHLYNVAEYYTRQNQYAHAYYAFNQYIKYCPQGENANKARQLMTKIAGYIKSSVNIEFKSDEFNRVYPKDSMIFSEGEPGEELFIIQKGSVKIVKIVNNNEVLLAVLKAGDIFGEMALLESKLRAACALAYEECHLMAVNRANFERMVSTQPQIVSRLTTLLAERIWFIYKQLANTLISDPVGRMYDSLLIQLEKNRIPINTSSHTFDFGPRELVNMVGIPQNEGTLVFQKLLKNKKIQVVNDKIHSTDVSEIFKHTEYYRKMEKIEKSRRENTAISSL
jgi:CRP-like cAMP-binding protein